MVNESMANNVYPVTLRAKDGRERRELVWFPNDHVRREFYDKARRNGLEVIINDRQETMGTDIRGTVNPEGLAG